MKHLRVAIYIRVSTQDQSLELQRSELTAFANARGWKITKVYEDRATGTNDNRPQLKELLKSARERKFDVLLIWKLDRLFRSIKGLVTSIQDFEALGIAFVSLKDQIDLSTPSGRLMVHMLGAFAEFEAALIRERVTAGVRAKIAKTGRWGPARKRDDTKIIELRRRGLSIREIAKAAGVSTTSVMRAVQGSKA